MLSRYNPFGDLSRLQSQLDQLMDWPSGQRLDATRGTSWIPAVDVFEDNERLLFKIDVPEVRKEDVNVRVDNGVLTIEGSRKLENEEKKNGYHRVERVSGKFARSFALPSTLATDAINAELKDGVLRVSVPKKREAQPRSIDIKVS
jgi:HSP20 family protein